MTDERLDAIIKDLQAIIDDLTIPDADKMEARVLIADLTNEKNDAS